MSDIAKLESLFFERTGMNAGRVDTLVGDALAGAARRMGGHACASCASRARSRCSGTLAGGGGGTVSALNSPVPSAIVAAAVGLPPAKRYI